eukprot:IDg13617t1
MDFSAQCDKVTLRSTVANFARSRSAREIAFRVSSKSRGGALQRCAQFSAMQSARGCAVRDVTQCGAVAMCSAR